MIKEVEAISPAEIDKLGDRINKQCTTTGLTFFTEVTARAPLPAMRPAFCVPKLVTRESTGTEVGFSTQLDTIF